MVGFIPDTQAHINVHAIITRTYSIFADLGVKSEASAIESRKQVLHLEKIDDLNYYGFITFESPDKLFTYTADGNLELSKEEVEQVIEFLSHYRNNPDLWDQE